MKCLLTSCLTLFRLSTLLWVGPCQHWILARFFWSKKPKHFSSNLGLCCFSSYRPRLSLGAVLVFSLMFFQVLFMSLLKFKFSKAADVFIILIWYCFLTSSSLSFLRLNLSTQTSVLLIYWLPVFPYLLHYQIVISIIVCYPERSHIEYTRMSSIYQYVINLVVTLPIRRGPGVFMNVSVRDHRARNNYIFWCGSFLISESKTRLNKVVDNVSPWCASTEISE